MYRTSLFLSLLFYGLINWLPLSLAAQSFPLREGDLLFQDLACGPLCDAIEAVTEGVDGRDFSHVGLVVASPAGWQVLEAVGQGVKLTPLRDFLARSGDTLVWQNTMAMRVRAEYAALVPAALAFAQAQLGQPYDHAFVFDNGRWYCSELLYAAFRVAYGDRDFFLPAPMTYRQPGQDAFFPAWEAYFAQLGLSIPEGQPGVNPGGLSRSEKLEKVPLWTAP